MAEAMTGRSLLKDELRLSLQDVALPRVQKAARLFVAVLATNELGNDGGTKERIRAGLGGSSIVHAGRV